MIHFTKIANKTYAFLILGGSVEFENNVIKSTGESEYLVRMVRVNFLDDYKIEDLQHIPEDSDHYREAQQLLGV